MELQEAKNPYDIFFKCHNIDEASIPERVMFDMMDLWESDLWQSNSEVKCSSYDVNDVACFAECGNTLKIFDTVEEIDTSKPIASIWANVAKRFYEDYEHNGPKEYDALCNEIKSKASLSNVGYWGKIDESWLHVTHPLGYTPTNSEWVLVTYN